MHQRVLVTKRWPKAGLALHDFCSETDKIGCDIKTMGHRRGSWHLP